jgi:hypothetical protein
MPDPVNEPVNEPVSPDLQVVGWQVVDPDGNVVQSGPVSEAQATAWLSEMIAEAARNEGEQ